MSESMRFFRTSRVFRRFVVDAVIVLCFAALGYYCYDAGKTYNVILANAPYTVDGVQYPAIEAMQVTIDGEGDPIYLLEDDSMVGSTSGKKHTLKIEILDEEDKPIEGQTKLIPFTMDQLGADMVINVVKAYALGKVS